MQRYVLGHLTDEDRLRLVKRQSSLHETDVSKNVQVIIDEVGRSGDKALRLFTEKFDGVALSDLAVSQEEILRAEQSISPELRSAIETAAANIAAFHSPQFPQPIAVEIMPGIVCRREWRPIQRVGFYIPGGSAPLLSTVLMLGIPANIAGCGERILCTPPTKEGTVAPEILFAARSVGIRNIFKVGGAQAIAAMALGTTSIPKVDKIFGPGNRYVATAKSIIAQPPYNTAIDLTAGPSELLIIADDSANPSWVAADLLSQAEHGEGSRVVLVSSSAALTERVGREIEKQFATLPRREHLRAALGESFTLIVQTLDEAISFSNRYAPEHLQLCVADAETSAKKIFNAGSVFIGSMSSVVFGDYASGTNHTLPTNGTASASGGITVESFMKPVSFQTITRNGFTSLAETVKTLARAEGLEAHAQAVVRREGTP